MSSSFRKLWNIFTSIIVALVVILALLLAGPRLIGMRAFTVLSGSMEPTYHTGSIIYVKKIPDTTKIIIAQRVASVQDADKIIVLNDGKVDAFDTHENLVENNAIYRDVYEAQVHGSGDFDEGGDN